MLKLGMLFLFAVVPLRCKVMVKHDNTYKAVDVFCEPYFNLPIGAQRAVDFDPHEQL
jgi:hypothetical protein